MSESSPAPQPGGQPPKRRHPVELFLVRGFILVMLVLIAIEGNSWWQHRKALNALTARMKTVDEVADSPPVTLADVKTVMGSKEPRTEQLEGWKNHVGANRVDIYSWFTISPVNKREIYVYYWKKSRKGGEADQLEDANPEVLAVQVDDKAPDEPARLASDEPMNPPAGAGPGMTPGMMPGMSGGAPAGMRGGRGGRPPTQGADADKEDTSKSETEKPDDGKADTEKTGDDKPADDKAGDDKPKDAEGEKEQQ
jgi:hypothetical protein